MRIDEIDTLLDLLDEYTIAHIHVQISKSKGLDQMATAAEMVLNSHRESIKEYLCELAKIKTQEPEEYRCPDCGSKMAQRRNKQSGHIFYGCTKYPECRGTRDESGLSKAEKADQNQKEKPAQQESYSFTKNREPWNESGPNNA